MKSYFICTTPRTGSTYLCSLLKSSQIAGVPESYFRKQDLKNWAKNWGIIASLTDDYLFKNYLHSCLAAGQTQNGVYACRIMWGAIEELVLNIKEHDPQDLRGDKEVLEKVFGDLNFIYLERKDYVAQAVSRLKAEQTDVWHLEKGQDVPYENNVLQYSFKDIHSYIEETRQHNIEWFSWFEQNNIIPHKVNYEDLLNNPNFEITKILKFLKLKNFKKIEFKSSNKKLSDDLSKKWIKRYNEEIVNF